MSARALPRRVSKTIRAQMIRAEIGAGNPFLPAVIWYVDDVPAMSWSDIGGIVAARSATRSLPVTECFPARYTPRVDRRPDVLRRLAAALAEWSTVPVGGAR